MKRPSLAALTFAATFALLALTGPLPTDLLMALVVCGLLLVALQPPPEGRA